MFMYISNTLLKKIQCGRLGPKYNKAPYHVNFQSAYDI